MMAVHKVVSDIWDEKGNLNREDASIILACETFSFGHRTYTETWDEVNCKKCLKFKEESK